MSNENIQPYVLIHVGKDGVEKVRLSALTPKVESESVKLYTKIHFSIRQINKSLKNLSYGGQKIDKKEELIRVAELKVQAIYLKLREQLEELDKLILQIRDTE